MRTIRSRATVSGSVTDGANVGRIMGLDRHVLLPSMLGHVGGPCPPAVVLEDVDRAEGTIPLRAGLMGPEDELSAIQRHADVLMAKIILPA